MRNNQPVTTLETQLPEGAYIYSRTNLKGVIEEANDAFVAISGYSREELIGQPHNLVRHPDVPAAAFEDMWRDLKAGRPWSGVVKNRRKDGGFYWVVANVSPVRENGQVVGYQSVRARPSREAIAAAQAAYDRVAQGDTRICVQHGRVVRSSSLVAHLLSLDTQLYLLCGTAALAAGVGLADAPQLYRLEQALRVLTLLGSGIVALLLVPKLNRDLQAVSDYLEQVLTTGNLKRRLPVTREDRVGHVAGQCDTLIASLQATVQGMADTAGQVAAANLEVRTGVTQVTRSAVVQSDSTAQAAAAVEEVTVSIGAVADHAVNTRNATETAVSTAQMGASRSLEASQNIQTLADDFQRLAQQVESLGVRSNEIGRVVAVIKEVADQTNLLALNAAIEAARAGEAGRGFAVVADEVRKLAERTGRATGEISNMIAGIQQETATAVQGMRDGTAQIEGSVRLVQSAQAALDQINQEMATTLAMMGDISSSTSEQRVAMEDLAKNVEQVAAMTEQTVVIVTQSEAMVGVLDGTVTRMRKAVGQYQV